MTAVVFADLVGSTSMFERLGDADASQFVTRLTGMLGEVFAGHQGRVVKVLGDGLFVVFEDVTRAVEACVHVQNHLLKERILPGGTGPAVQMQIGIESGEVVVIDGDCFGDTVNSAARLADLAGAGQILTTENVWKTLRPEQQATLRSMGPMYLRGKAEASHIYRVEWLAGRDEDSTMVGKPLLSAKKLEHLELTYGDQVLTVQPRGSKLTMGRSAEAGLIVNDPRVSRVHASVAWQGGHFLLCDTSSYGTWVYLGSQSEPVVLRRTECYLIGTGTIVAGCERTDANAPCIEFAVKG
jgi:class 3 adenylate cyclase